MDFVRIQGMAGRCCGCQDVATVVKRCNGCTDAATAGNRGVELQHGTRGYQLVVRSISRHFALGVATGVCSYAIGQAFPGRSGLGLGEWGRGGGGVPRQPPSKRSPVPTAHEYGTLRQTTATVRHMDSARQAVTALRTAKGRGAGRP